MDPIEKQIKTLPWKKPPEALKERIFCENKVKAPLKITILWHLSRNRPSSWAAAAVFLVSLASLALIRRNTIPTSPPLLVHADSFAGNENQTERNFFDLSNQAESPWKGPLTLTVDPN